MRKLKPCLKPYIGCLNCGGEEMKRVPGEIRAEMFTRIHGGFGGWKIKAASKVVYDPPPDLDWEEYPTLRKFELKARREPNRDWRAIYDGAMRSAEYQRQGYNRWVLVKSGKGFA